MSSISSVPKDVLLLGAILGLGCSYYTWRPLLNDPHFQNPEGSSRLEEEKNELKEKIRVRQELLKQQQQQQQQQQPKGE
ncbi:hypothetical protein DIPPA_04128 [Diplonema papillatum]|nr:hypothetical protein DIPPA_04128 [Diplonema papillatum]